MKQVHLFCIIMFLLLGSTNLQASHMFGEDMSYRCLGNNQYEIILRQYWDYCSSNGSSDYTITIEAPSCNQNFTYNLPYFYSTNTPSCGGNCNQIRIWKGVITLPTNCPDWRIWRQDPSIIANNIIPRTGFPSDRYVTEVYINNTNGLCNNSPIFTDIPPFSTCINQSFQYDYGAAMNEQDGDSLVFRLMDVKNGDSTFVTYASGFSGTQPFSSVSGVVLDSISGLLSFMPTTTQRAVYNVVIEEYRNGILIGSSRSVNTLSISNCSINSPPQIDSVWLVPTYGAPTLLTDKTILNMDHCPGASIHLRVKVSDPDPTDSIRWYSNGSNVSGGTLTFPNATLNQYNQAVYDVTFTTIGSPFQYRLVFWDGACPNAGYDYLFVNMDTSSACAKIRGGVVKDMNNNCSANFIDIPLENFIVLANKGNYSQFATTDASGQFTMNIDTGNYVLKIFPPNQLWQTCLDSIPVSLPLYTSQTFTSFVMDVSTDCPMMGVDISTPLIRRCDSNIYTINYCNNGTDTAYGAYVDVTFDSAMMVINSSIPWTQVIGNTYRFPIGDVGFNTCGQFQATVQVDCPPDILLGQTHCTAAHIYPDSFCLSPTNWSGANIEVSATCLTDSIEFIINNSGTGSMQAPLTYFITKDLQQITTASYQLNAGQSMRVVVPATGHTYRLEAMQESNHPFGNVPSAGIERCGPFPHSVGILPLFVSYDELPYLSLDCQPNVGAYDPNIKVGYPLGYGSHHYINQNQELEYHIHFQNTGTDTAFKVVIIDSITPLLDISSIQPGASSHPYQWSLQGNGELKVAFPGIELPDSNTNEAASHGFVKFKIKQQRDLPIGTVIENRAAIYFDENLPIITPIYFHTIGENFIQVLSNATTLKHRESIVTIFPNPFKDQVTIQIKSDAYQQYQLEIMDLNGRLLKQVSSQNSPFTFSADDLSAGIYIYRLKGDQQLLDTGKIIAY